MAHQFNIEIVQKCFKTQPVFKAYVFGSYARQQATSSSDLDLLIYLKYSQIIGLKFVQMKIDLENC